MINYIKSELYRILHGKEIYMVTTVISALVVCLNLILFLFGRNTSDFPYATVRFSMNTYTGSLVMTLCAGFMIVAYLYMDERKNGIMKNAVAYGISRTNLFIGKCIVSMIICIVSLVLILTVYIGSSILLLEGSVGLPLQKMLEGTAAAIPAAAASVVLGVALFTICKNETAAIIWWIAIMFLIPNVCFYLGLKVDILSDIASWMPANYLSREVIVTMGDYNCLWETVSGIVKCIVSGAAGIVIFGLTGIYGFKKKDM